MVVKWIHMIQRVFLVWENVSIFTKRNKSLERQWIWRAWDCSRDWRQFGQTGLLLGQNAEDGNLSALNFLNEARQEAICWGWEGLGEVQDFILQHGGHLVEYSTISRKEKAMGVIADFGKRVPQITILLHFCSHLIFSWGLKLWSRYLNTTICCPLQHSCPCLIVFIALQPF